jgi:hypothetical protein
VTEERQRLERAVIAAMDRATKQEMAWGSDDCALWCADILKEALGYDGAERFRGRYRTRIGAMRALGRDGLAAALRAASRERVCSSKEAASSGVTMVISGYSALRSFSAAIPRLSICVRRGR